MKRDCELTASELFILMESIKANIAMHLKKKHRIHIIHIQALCELYLKIWDFYGDLLENG